MAELTDTTAAAPATELIAADWLIPVDGRPIRNGGVLVGEGRIVAVGPRDELVADRVSSYEQAVVLPGFVNAHSHIEYASFAGFGDGLDFGPWVALHMQRKRLIGPADLLASARLGAASCLASGITATMDASYAGVAASACAELGLRAIVCLEVFGSDPDAAQSQFETKRAHFDYGGAALVRLGVSPHAPFTVGPDVYRWAHELELPLSTHVAESTHEHEFMVSGSGPIQQVAAMCHVDSPETTSVRHLYEAGLLDETMNAAHCVTVDAEDMGLLAETDTPVAHCPRSNAQLGCGIAPVVELIERGVRVGIGTDSPASAPDIDMFAEMRATIAGARLRARAATALQASDALELATLGSARAIGLETEVGSLTPGKHADMSVVSLADSAYDPVEDPEAAVVYGGSPDRILRTITSGTTRYERGEFEWHELREAARAARARMLEVNVTAAT